MKRENEIKKKTIVRNLFIEKNRNYFSNLKKICICITSHILTNLFFFKCPLYKISFFINLHSCSLKYL